MSGRDARPTPVVATSCPPGYSTYHAKLRFTLVNTRNYSVCFAVLETPPLSPGNHTCLNQGGRLATVMTPSEDAFVLHLFHTAKAYQSQSPDKARLGGKVRRGQLLWDSQCYAQYVSRALLEDTNEEERCVGLNYVGEWVAVDCDEPTQYVVCEIRKGTNT